jgi:membrane fusion protein (multidrug efflux system)
LRAYVIAVTLLLVLLGGTGLYLQQRFSAFAAADFTPPPATVAAAQARSAPWRETTMSQAGQLLLSIDDVLEVATRQRILARLELAELLYERDASLIRQKSIPQTQLDQSRADLAPRGRNWRKSTQSCATSA